MVEQSDVTGNRVLIVYASWTGATREVAEAIGRAMGELGIATDVVEASKVKTIAPYRAVVIGNGVHAGKLTGHTINFGKRFAAELEKTPNAWFVVCLTMVEDTPETRATTNGYLDQLRKVMPAVQPVDVALFAGAVLQGTPDAKRLWFPVSGMVRSMAASTPDKRDWDAIAAWAKDVAVKLIPQKVTT